VAQLFSKFGPVRSIKVKRPEIDPRFAYQTSGYAIAYVNFEKEEDAVKAIAELNNQIIGNQVISVVIYDRSQQAHVFVGSQDVIMNENMKALHIQGISKDVSNKNQRNIVRLVFLWAYR
jgi:RNA recognition motif-containing protein